VAAAARLDGGLLVGTDHIGVRLQLLVLKDPVVQVQDHPGLGGEVGVAREDPGAVLPRLDRVLGQPAPQRRGRDVVDQAGGQDLGAQLGEAPPAKRYPAGGGQLAGDRLARGDHPGRKGAWAAGPLAVTQTFHALLEEPLAPLAGRVGRQSKLAGDPPIGPPCRGQQDDPGPGHLAVLGRAPAHQRLQQPPLRRPQRDLEWAAPAATCHHPSRPQAGPVAGRGGRLPGRGQARLAKMGRCPRQSPSPQGLARPAVARPPAAALAGAGRRPCALPGPLRLCGR
jgi:hypothetical protein